MNLIIEAAVRIMLFFAALWFLTLDAALFPFVNGIDDYPVNMGFVTGFLNVTTPQQLSPIPLTLFLLARALFGMGVAIYALMPAIKVFMDADVRAINRDVFLVFLGLSIAAFILGVLSYWTLVL